MNEQLNRRMKRFYREYFWDTFLDYNCGVRLVEECPKEKFFTLSLQKKIVFAEKVYVEVRKRHKSEEILDMGSARVQPRIDSKFRKKPKKRTGQH